MKVIFGNKGFIFEANLFDNWGTLIELGNYNYETKIRTPNTKRGLAEIEFLHDITIKDVIFEYCKLQDLETEFDRIFEDRENFVIDEDKLFKIDRKGHKEIKIILEEQILLQLHPLVYIPKDIPFQTRYGSYDEFNEILAAIILLAERYGYRSQITVIGGNAIKKGKIVSCEPVLEALINEVLDIYDFQGGFYFKNGSEKLNEIEEGDTEEFWFIGRVRKMDAEIAKDIFSYRNIFIKARERILLKEYLKDKLKAYKNNDKEIDRVFSSA